MSPRRTRPTQRKRRVIVEAPPRPNTDQLARDLVRRGLADPRILGVRDYLPRDDR